MRFPILAQSRTRRLFLFLVCLCAFTVSAQTPGRYPYPESTRYGKQIAQARARVEEIMKTLRITGMSVAVGINGTIVWSEGFGFADIEQGVGVTPLSRFRLGSVSKVLTAAGVARLVEEGKLDLDAPVQRYVPSFPEKPWPVTTRQLTGHTAGIRHYLPRDFAGPLAGVPHFDSVSRGLTIFKDDPLVFEPGSKYAYSSYGWNLVSAVVEGASGLEFLTYMQSTVFEPLGLRSATADHVDRIIPNRVDFYERNRAGELVHAPHIDSSYKWAGGGFMATAEDLVRFGSAHLQPGFLSQSTLDLMFTSQKLTSGKETGTGIGWRIGVDPQGRKIYHHGGTIEGGRAMLMLFPESKVVVALLSNMLARYGEKEAMEIGSIFLQ